ncbi:MAG: sulfotransferase [Hyphomonadaceae bacterium]
MPQAADPIAALRAAWAAGAHAEVAALAAAEPRLLQHDEAAFKIALARIQLGETAAAQGLLEEILVRNPGLAPARAALCKLHIVGGNMGAAEPLLAELGQAATQDARAGAAWGEALMQAGRVGQAHVAFERYARTTGDPAAYVSLAETALRMGDAAQALAHARRARGALPLSPSVLAAWGAAVFAAGAAAEREEALAALAATPQRVAILQTWTEILVAGDRLSEAEATATMLTEAAPSAARWRFLADLRLSNLDVAGAGEAIAAALRLAPEDAATLAMAARCRIVAGELDEATALALRAIAADPSFVGGYDYLSQIDVARVTPHMRSELDALRRAPGKSADDRARAALALGRAAEAAGEYAAAFDLYADANRLLATRFAQAGRGYDAARTEADVRSLAAAFPAPIRAAAADTAGPRLIFIVGMPRSGTSLVEQILGAHPAVAAAGELPSMMRIADAFVRRARSERVQAVLDAAGAEWAALYRGGLPKGAHDKPAVTDKHPLNFWNVGLIKALFPEARIVHVSRNPADTALSIFKERFYAGYSFANDLDAIAHHYASYERLMAHWRGVFPGEIFEARYEEFVADLEANAKSLIAFCAQDWDPACLAFHRSKRAVFTHSAAQVRKPLSSASVSRSARFGDRLESFEEALARYRRGDQG